jgi:PAS domain S-box-containing protein
MAQHKKVLRKPKSSPPEKSHSPYILLVEDEPTHVAVMRHTIQTANPNVVVKVAGSLKEYRSALEQSLPEIALIDMHLPDGKALEVLTSPPEAGPFPIVVMTSSGDEKIAVKAMKAGALDYIVKTTESFKEMPHTIERSLHEWKLIQERTQAEEALRESELRFHSFYENVVVGLYRTTPAGKILLANRALVKILGYSTFEQLSERNLSKVGFAQSSQRKVFLRDIEMEGEVNDFESAWIRQDGSLVIVRESARAIRDPQGKTLYYDGAVEDITERRLAEVAGRHAENALRESEEEFRSIAENFHDVLFITDTKGTITYISSAVNNVFGYNSEDMKGHFFGEYLSETELTRVLPIFEDAIRNGIPTKNITILAKRKDGNTFQAELYTSVIEKNGKVQGTTGVIRDISERKRVEEALRESEEKFLTLFKAAPGSMILTSLPDGKTLDVNDNFSLLTGYSREEVLGKTTGDLNMWIDPHDRDRFLSLLQQDGIVQNFEADMNHKSGAIRKGTIAGQTFTVQSKKYLIGTFYDITDRKRSEVLLKQSETRYRLLADHMKDTIWLMDMNLKTTYISPSVEKLRGYTLKELQQLPLEQQFTPASFQLAMDAFSDEIQKVTSDPTYFILRTLELEFYRKDGTTYWSENRFSLIRDENGNPESIMGEGREITDRKRAEEELRKTNDRLHMALESAHSGTWEWDLLTNENIWSDELWKLYGIEPHSCVASYEVWRESIYAEDREKTEKKVQEAVREGKELNAEWRVAGRDDSVRWLMSRGRPSRDAKGNVVRFNGIVVDITERKQADEAVRASEGQFRDLWGATVEGIVILDKGIIIEVNDAMCRMFGYTREYSIGKSLLEFAPPEMCDRIRERIASGIEGRFETPAIRADGTRMILEIFAKRFTYQGKSMRMVTVNDITERKRIEEALRESELRFRSLYENTTIGLYRTTPDGKILMANPTLVKMLGYASFQDLAERNLEQDGFEPSYQRKEFLEKIERESVVNGLESKWIRQDGTTIFVVESARAIRDPQGTTLYYDGTLEDVTERKRVAEALRQMQKLEGLGTLAGGIAHDFNNILGIILAYNSSIERSKGDTKKLDLATETITKAVQRGKTLVQQILTFARKTDTAFGAVNVNDVVMEIMTMILETFPKVLTYAQNFEKGIPFISADRSQLHQALLNLCVNARDAMPSGGVLNINTRMVSVASLRIQHPDAAANSYVCIEVSDTGEGMTPEIQKRIFEPFFTTKGIGKGTGLGLSVVFGVIQTHKGFIDVESELGKGTTFRIYLPVTQVAEPISVKDEETLEEIRGGTETLLVVEDEEMLMMSLRMVLIEKGYKVLSAEDGLTAVKTYQERKNDIALVLTDLGLPNITGLEVCQRIKKINPKERIILATGFLDPEMKSEFLKAGIQHFLYKPYDLIKVLKAIREVLDGK